MTAVMPSHGPTSVNGSDITLQDDQEIRSESQDDLKPRSSSPTQEDNETSKEKIQRARKRTKTGCLTCRRRRIKCGEERPKCGNCVKSKRVCEGYAPRLTFRDPLSTALWGVRADTAAYQQGIAQNGAAGQYSRLASAANGRSQYPPLAPRLGPRPSVTSQGPLPAVLNEQQNNQPTFIPRQEELRILNGQPPQGFDFSVPPKVEPLQENTHPYHHYRDPLSHQPQPPFNHENSIHAVHHGQVPQHLHTSSGPIDHQPAHQPAWQSPPLNVGEVTPINATHIGISQPGNEPYDEWYPPPSSYADEYHGQSAQHTSFVEKEAGVPRSNFQTLATDQTGEVSSSSDATDIDHWASANGNRDVVRKEEPIQHQRYEMYRPDSHPKPEQVEDQDVMMQHFFPEGNYCVEPEEDYWDVLTDEEDNGESERRLATMPHNDLGLMLALRASRDDTVPRSFTTFLNEPNVLAHYVPRFNVSPLMDAKTARVFCHFITSTGPTLSINERHPANPMVMFKGTPVPPSQQGLWTYTLPMMALSSPALLHSMLGLASLHIARLQGTSVMPSLRHYHYAIRCIAKSVAIPSKRSDTATLAATLILSFYEAGTAEHVKWSSHLTGARQLLMEINFKEISQRLKAARERQEAMRATPLWPSVNANGLYSDYSNYMNTQLSDVDEIFISSIVGSRVRYNDSGRVIDNENETMEDYRKPPTPREIENYKITCDLFWWYCKQDVYQSTISGNPPLLPYEYWTHCAPRAPCGVSNATYGTMDHLVLLMGRIADFAARDQMRKRKAVKANGGQWRPPPGMFPGGPPGAPPGGPPGMPPGRHPGMPSGIPLGASPNIMNNPSAGTPNGGPPASGRLYPQTPSGTVTGMPSGLPPVASPTTPMGGPPGMPPGIPSGVPPGGRAPMYGMMPASAPVPIPPAFLDAPRDRIYFPRPLSEDDIQLASATIEAEREWEEISRACDIFEASLGEHFQPLPPDVQPPRTTPFGDTLEYRSYPVASIWIMFYTGRIIVARTQPCMPPAAMMAAGVAAAKTAHLAQLVARIALGLQPPPSNQPLNPVLGAALMESSMGWFFAGVQYRDAAQRKSAVETLRRITLLTGWSSTALIAAGLEVSWIKMHEAGRGPPYTRTKDVGDVDDRTANSRPSESSTTADRSLASFNPKTRMHYAMGIMSDERDCLDDLQGLSLT
ncbi:hypothetical protein MMC25_005776 [Agyrium rufum]|nr:hypothetical protein [Agyrium rufum]